MKEKLLFAALSGYHMGQDAAVIMSDRCLPIACSHSAVEGIGIQISLSGFHACWESYADAVEFFNCLGIEAIRAGNEDTKPAGWKPEGLYVYEVSYEEEDVDQDCLEDWSHLMNGKLRRPTIDELEPLTRGLAPWDGLVL